MQARAWLAAALQLPLPGMCVSLTGLQPSPAAPTAPRTCQRTEEGSSVLFLSVISYLPLRRMPRLSLASSPSRSALHQHGGGACSCCPGKQDTQEINSGLAARAAPGSHPPRSSTRPSCCRPASKSVLTGAPGPFAHDTAGPQSCSLWLLAASQPGPAAALSMPQPSPALR